MDAVAIRDSARHPAVDSDHVPSSNTTTVDRRERPPRSGGSVEIVTYQEKVRWKLARYLILLLAAVIFMYVVLAATTAYTQLTPADLREMFGLIIGALVSLVSSAVGFYFGAERAQSKYNTEDPGP